MAIVQTNILKLNGGNMSTVRFNGNSMNSILLNNSLRWIPGSKTIGLLIGSSSRNSVYSINPGSSYPYSFSGPNMAAFKLDNINLPTSINKIASNNEDYIYIEDFGYIFYSNYATINSNNNASTTNPPTGTYAITSGQNNQNVSFPNDVTDKPSLYFSTKECLKTKVIKLPAASSIDIETAYRTKYNSNTFIVPNQEFIVGSGSDGTLKDMFQSVTNLQGKTFIQDVVSDYTSISNCLNALNNRNYITVINQICSGNKAITFVDKEATVNGLCLAYSTKANTGTKYINYGIFITLGNDVMFLYFIQEPPSTTRIYRYPITSRSIFTPEYDSAYYSASADAKPVEKYWQANTNAPSVIGDDVIDEHNSLNQPLKYQYLFQLGNVTETDKYPTNTYWLLTQQEYICVPVSMANGISITNSTLIDSNILWGTQEFNIYRAASNSVITKL